MYVYIYISSPFPIQCGFQTDLYTGSFWYCVFAVISLLHWGDFLLVKCRGNIGYPRLIILHVVFAHTMLHYLLAHLLPYLHTHSKVYSKPLSYPVSYVFFFHRPLWDSEIYLTSFFLKWLFWSQFNFIDCVVFFTLGLSAQILVVP